MMPWRLKRLSPAEKARPVTQPACSFSVRMCSPVSAAHTLMVESCEPEKRSPSPPHRTELTEAACPHSATSMRSYWMHCQLCVHKCS